jgi:hypothetical protein
MSFDSWELFTLLFQVWLSRVLRFVRYLALLSSLRFLSRWRWRQRHSCWNPVHPREVMQAARIGARVYEYS